MATKKCEFPKCGADADYTIDPEDDEMAMRVCEYHLLDQIKSREASEVIVRYR